MARKTDVTSVKRAQKETKSRDEGSVHLKMKDEGDYIAYVCFPCRDGYDRPELEVHKHFGLGPQGKDTATCLNGKRNPVVDDDRMHAFLPNGAEDVKTGEEGCYACKVAFDQYRKVRGDKKKEEAAKAKMPRKQFLYNVVLVAFRKAGEDEFKAVEKDKLRRQVLTAGSKLYDDITLAYIDYGDISDPDAAKLFRINRTGKDWNNTRYKGTMAPPPFDTAWKMPKELRAKLDAELNAGEAGDLFKVAADGVVNAEDLEALAQGLGLESADSNEPPACYEKHYEPEDDAECGKCPFRGPCSQACEKELGPNHALKEGDKGFEGGEEKEPEEEKPVAKRPAKAAAAPEPAAKKPEPKPAAKPTPKPAPKKEPEPEEEVVEEVEAETEETEETSGDEFDDLRALGFSDDNIISLADEAITQIREQSLKAKDVSILSSGKIRVKTAPVKEEPKKPVVAKKPAPPPEPEEEEDEGNVDDAGDPPEELDELEAKLLAATKGKK